REPGRDHHAEAREEADRPLAARELAQIHVQRAGEEQEREHAVEQRAVEIHRAERALRRALRIQAEPSQSDQRQRQRQGEKQQRDARRLADEAVVEPAEERRQRDQRSGGAQRVHRFISTRRKFKVLPARVAIRLHAIPGWGDRQRPEALAEWLLPLSHSPSLPWVWLSLKRPPSGGLFFSGSA